ncbi:hypothetical protein [Oleiagrimonas sp. C23AA]|uniref:hypothetical protein n=1 Tax=Oleiagrimonas sp. C23AA TaxID=2719047 RepID=UPI00142443F0|nr:hypothetical protein [Oleiagrimonas sp. C23AA]NII11555.1 hypothetical protein [Oleiagrimonas sp. C23AA]
MSDDKAKSGYPQDEPQPNRPHPKGPQEGHPHEHQNDPARKPGDEHERGDKP